MIHIRNTLRKRETITMKTAMIISALLTIMFFIIDVRDGIPLFNGSTLMTALCAAMMIFFYGQYDKEKNS